MNTSMGPFDIIRYRKNIILLSDMPRETEGVRKENAYVEIVAQSIDSLYVLCTYFLYL